MSEPAMQPNILVVLGATGDLMARKIAPSLFYLFGKGLLPEQLWVVGFGRQAVERSRAPAARPGHPRREVPRRRTREGRRVPRPTSATSTATSISPKRSWTSTGT